MIHFYVIIATFLFLFDDFFDRSFGKFLGILTIEIMIKSINLFD